MTSAPSLADSVAEDPTSELPSYTEIGDGTSLWARLPSGKTEPAERSRARAYPGLASAAPPTSTIYRLACSKLPSGGRALDAGCGPGNGLRELVRHFNRVVGIDHHAGAADFARAFCPRAHVVQGDIANPPEGAQYDAVFLMDVLGQVLHPFAVLRALYHKLAPEGTLVVGEPAAFPSQCLQVPSRRAFSERSLSALLSASGYKVRDWLLSSGNFPVCLAVKEPEDQHQALLEGERAFEAGQVARALDAYQRASMSSNPSVQFEASLSLAELYLACNEGDAACASFFDARKRNPSDPRPLAGLAQINLAIGDTSNALALAQRALKLDSTDPGAACAEAVCLERVAPSEALASWRRATNLVPDNTAVATRFARAATAVSDFDSAIHVLERLRLYGNADAFAVHLELARTLVSAGRLSDAQLEFGIARAMAPDHPEVALLANQLAPAGPAVARAH